MRRQWRGSRLVEIHDADCGKTKGEVWGCDCVEDAVLPGCAWCGRPATDHVRSEGGGPLCPGTSSSFYTRPPDRYGEMRLEDRLDFDINALLNILQNHGILREGLERCGACRALKETSSFCVMGCRS